MAKSELIQIRTDPETKAAIQAAAEEENRTVSGWVMNIIKQKLEEEKETPDQ